MWTSSSACAVDGVGERGVLVALPVPASAWLAPGRVVVERRGVSRVPVWMSGEVGAARAAVADLGVDVGSGAIVRVRSAVGREEVLGG